MNDLISDYREVAKATHAYWQKRFEIHATLEADYGKWLIASIFIVNAGGLLGISQAGEIAKDLFSASGRLFAWGIIFAILAGMSAWINQAFFREMYDKMVRSFDVLVDRGEWPHVDPLLVGKINAAYYISVIFGLSSVLFFGLGVWAMFGVID